MKLRFFMSWDGEFLWPADEEADAAFGAPVHYDDLPISDVTRVILWALSESIDRVAESKEANSEAFWHFLHAVEERLKSELAAEGIQLEELDPVEEA